MGNTAQKRALRNYRSRLTKRGIARFEVLGLEADRELIRALARRLAEAGPETSSMRAAVNQLMTSGAERSGRILDALRRSPLAHMDLDLKRAHVSGRKVDL